MLGTPDPFPPSPAGPSGAPVTGATSGRGSGKGARTTLTPPMGLHGVVLQHGRLVAKPVSVLECLTLSVPFRAFSNQGLWGRGHMWDSVVCDALASEVVTTRHSAAIFHLRASFRTSWNMTTSR